MNKLLSSVLTKPCGEIMRITPKNWRSFQHYKDRNPPWIKLHRGLLNDYSFACLPLASKALAPCLWLLAAEHDDGIIDASIEEMAFRVRMTNAEVSEGLNALINKGFFVSDSEMLADCKQVATLEIEKETYRKETETKKETEKRERTPRATRLSQDWQPSNSDLDYARQLGWSDKQVRDTAQDFSDYWMAKSGQGATKVDWSATWRRWCRNTAPKADATSRADRLMQWAEQKELEKNELKQIDTGSFDPFSLLPAVKSG